MGYGQKDIYLIFPYDKDRNVAGVYVGSSRQLKMRLNRHKHGNKFDPENDPQRELHKLMRENGFECIRVDTADFKTKWKEYIWIDMFCKYTNLRVFNKLRGSYGQYGAGHVYGKYWGSPSTEPLSREMRERRANAKNYKNI